MHSAFCLLYQFLILSRPSTTSSPASLQSLQEPSAESLSLPRPSPGTGKRISIKDTRGIIDAILDGSIDKAETKKLPIFNLSIPTALPGVDTNILDPRDTYKDASEWETKAKDLAGRFIKNFVKYENNEKGKSLVKAGPQL